MTSANFDAVRAARADLDAVIDEIREIDGFQQFLAAPTFDDVVEATRGRTLVYLTAVDADGLALVVRDGDAGHLILPGLSDEATGSRALEYQRRHERFRTAEKADKDAAWAHWGAHLDTVSGWLWDVAMEPLIDELGLTGDTPDQQVVLVPCGELGLLPLHAAWTPDAARPTGRRYAIDHATWTYTANARAFLACRQIAETAELRRSAAVAAPSGGARMSAIRVVSAAVKAWLPEGPAALAGEAATLAALTGAMRDVDLLHLGLHGNAELEAPLDSHLELADGKLPLREVLKMRLRIRLAVIAACETAMSGTTLPDEVVSLPTGLVQAGVGGVVASMWGCDQYATALVLTDFYRRLRAAPATPSTALAGAQRWLRDLTVDQLRAEYEQALDEKQSWLPDETGDALLDDLIGRGAGGPRPWSDIPTWAALSYTGG